MSWGQVPTFLRDKNSGEIYMNPAKDWVQPFELTVSKPNQIIKLLAGETRGPFPLTAQYDGPIECFYVKCNVYAPAADPSLPGALLQTYDIDFLLEHPGKRIQFSNRKVPLIALSGNGGQPYVLSEEGVRVGKWLDDAAKKAGAPPVVIAGFAHFVVGEGLPPAGADET
jgi:hypothetical protein